MIRPASTGSWALSRGCPSKQDDSLNEQMEAMCDTCGLPLEEGGHAHCKNRVEVVACPEHRDEERRRMKEGRKEYERRAAEFGFDGKWARMKALPDGPEKHALAGEIVEWMFGGGDKQRP